jgi:hypothetical protein
MHVTPEFEFARLYDSTPESYGLDPTDAPVERHSA